MRAVVCHAPLNLRIEPLDTEVPGPRQLRVRVAFGGTVRLKEPMDLGHEASGEMEALGSEVSHLRPGQRLVDGRPVISHTVPLADAARAFELAGDKRRAMKVQIGFGDLA